MATPAHIVSEAQGIKTQAPFLSTGQNLSFSLREQLERLASLAGMTEKTATDATDNDLISVYLTALKNGAAATQVARKVSTRLGDTNPFFTDPDTVPAPTNPMRREPAPRMPDPRTGETPTPRDDGPSLDVIRNMIKTEVREGAVEPLQAALDKTVDTFFAELARVPLTASEAALAAMRSEINDAVQTAALEAVRNMTPTRLEIMRPDGPPPVQLGLVHFKTPQVIAALSAGVNVYLYGPAGSGKTTMAEKVATAFGQQAYYAAKVESEYQLLGFKDAKGDTVRTQFREAYEHGGVFLFDELDGSAPSAVVALNMALANGVCPFPDGMIKRHANFLCIAAGNTKLTGATRQYAGRNQLDAASIDRFAFIEFGYDDDLERALATDASWCKYVQRVRAVVAERGLPHLVTPRATYDGCKLLAQGMDRDTVAGMVVYKGLDADTVRQIQAAL